MSGDAAAAVVDQPLEQERCGLCRKGAKKLTRTECCGRPICDVGEDGRSYPRGSCSRKHSRLTLCGHHHAAKHTGDWKTCGACRKDFEVEMYVYYGTNAHNFEKLENPPAYEPTHCGGCGRVIVLSKGDYSTGPDGYRCQDCFGD